MCKMELKTLEKCAILVLGHIKGRDFIEAQCHSGFDGLENQ